MVEYDDSMGCKISGIIKNIEDALEVTDKFFKTIPSYSSKNPAAVDEFHVLQKHHRNYLECFNQDWVPMSFSKIENALSEAKLEYACSADYLDKITALHLTQNQQEFLHKNSDPIFYQTIRDLMINARFRKDYWV